MVLPRSTTEKVPVPREEGSEKHRVWLCTLAGWMVCLASWDLPFLFPTHSTSVSSSTSFDPILSPSACLSASLTGCSSPVSVRVLQLPNLSICSSLLHLSPPALSSHPPVSSRYARPSHLSNHVLSALNPPPPPVSSTRHSIHTPPTHSPSLISHSSVSPTHHPPTTTSPLYTLFLKPFLTSQPFPLPTPHLQKCTVGEWW
ncbi:hypothetical protein Pmani_029909 [Petrolisthes manimaculis]|uniref:Uncharacterized protein n=1 Tax=Petrolisthes manimaculis TaxID=1843537 RepID=A0AAE1NWP7_9EUCA|nr:hypothetical protein Pmani_029909 [Petrolisthes manimaculis]